MKKNIFLTEWSWLEVKKNSVRFRMQNDRQPIIKLDKLSGIRMAKTRWLPIFF
jgi:hypothetical protein